MKKIIIIIFLILSLTSFCQVKITMERDGGVFFVPCKVNGLPLKFIFDTGASEVSLSFAEFAYMYKNGYIKDSDIKGSSYASIANGDVVEKISIVLKEIEIGGLKLYNVNASVDYNLTAPLLLGQSAIQKLGTYQINGNVLTIMNARKGNNSTTHSVTKANIPNDGFSYTGLTPNMYKQSDIVVENPYIGCIDSNLTIHRVVITQQYTIIEMQYKGNVGQKYNVDKNASIVYNDKTGRGKFVSMIKAENIACNPNQAVLKDNKLCFRLYFPRIQVFESDRWIRFVNTDDSKWNGTIYFDFKTKEEYREHNKNKFMF